MLVCGMIRKYVEQYLTFTKGERQAVIALSAILLLLFALPKFLPQDKIEVDDRQLLNFAEDRLTTVTESLPKPSSNLVSDNKAAYKRVYFDPNTLDASGWVSMGVKEKTALTIQHYLEKGGRFRKADDILKIYGLPGALAAELMAYVRIRDVGNGLQGSERKRGKWSNDFYDRKSYGRNAGSDDSISYRKEGVMYSSRSFGYKFPSRKIHSGTIDIAIADTAALTTLPGIGSKLALRIVSFRQKLGGFHSVEQLAEVFGIQDSLYQQLKPLLAASSGHISPININTASEEMLKAHPYIRWQLAKLIVNYRTEHGPFRFPTDLEGLQTLTEEGLKKLLPYLQL
jgi:competence protein ComEA